MAALNQNASSNISSSLSVNVAIATHSRGSADENGIILVTLMVSVVIVLPQAFASGPPSWTHDLSHLPLGDTR